MILGINGHPRNEGTCRTLLEEALEGAAQEGAETLLVSVCEYHVRRCDFSEWCSSQPGCSIVDDMWKIYPLLAECTGLIVAAPVAFAGVPSDLKAWIDRCNPFYKDRKIFHRNLFPYRPGALIATAGSDRPADFIGTIEPVRAFFFTLGVQFEAQLIIGGLDTLPPPHPIPEHRTQARRIGAKIANLQNSESARWQPDLPWWNHIPEDGGCSCRKK
ncbi:MAG TPA: flavodoxin family protein [bacterium]|nr:flavodoxin family protein [bacterium]HQL62070.1 flavodoxin family protein [bacterium]